MKVLFDQLPNFFFLLGSVFLGAGTAINLWRAFAHG